jgi:hypothetical protein
VDRYLTIRSGDVKKLRPPLTGFRLRCSDYRVFFDHKEENTIEITGVRNRREAYRRRRQTEKGTKGSENGALLSLFETDCNCL